MTFHYNFLGSRSWRGEETIFLIRSYWILSSHRWHEERWSPFLQIPTYSLFHSLCKMCEWPLSSPPSRLCSSSSPFSSCLPLPLSWQGLIHGIISQTSPCITKNDLELLIFPELPQKWQSYKCDLQSPSSCIGQMFSNIVGRKLSLILLFMTLSFTAFSSSAWNIISPGSLVCSYS